MSHLAFHPAGEAHSDFWHEIGGRCLHVEFDAGWIRQIGEYSAAFNRPVEFHGGTPVWLVARLYQELRAPDDLTPLAAEGLALELVAQAARETARAGWHRPPAWLDRVKELIESRFREQLTLQELARAAGVHPVHVVAVFRRFLHYTPFDFLRQRRIAFASGRLVNSDASLVAIALEAGFSHQSHFCRVFKAATGMTPAVYRRLFARRS